MERDYERRTIGYRLVRLLDSPDELRSQEIGVLDQGDEVQLLRRQGVYWFVLCPDGRQGWVHRMVLADRADLQAAEVQPVVQEPIPSAATPSKAWSDDIVREPGADGLLDAYIKARGEVLRSTGNDQPVAKAPEKEAAALETVAAEPAVTTEPETAEPAVAAEPETAAVSTTAVEETSAGQAPVAEPEHADGRYSGRKREGTRKAATGSRPGAKSRRPSR